MKSFYKRRRPVQKALRIISIIVIIVVIFAAIIASTTSKPAVADQAWDKEMTIGDLNAKNHFIIYSDMVCPYCVAFENAIVENEEEFQNYIKENDIFVEVRLSDFLYEYGQVNHPHSRYSAIATYCAKNEGKFWDYYNLAISSVWNDFFKKDGKSALSNIAKQDASYWTKIGKRIGLGESYEECIENQAPLEEIKQNAEKSAKLIDGMPYFKFNNYTNSGFDLSWGWDYVKAYFDAGLNS